MPLHLNWWKSVVKQHLFIKGVNYAFLLACDRELKMLGETWMFNDPSLARSYEKWVLKNAEAIALIQMLETFESPVIFEYQG